MGKKVIVYLDGPVNIREIDDYRSCCDFISQPYDDASQLRKNVQSASPSKMQWRDWNTPWEQSHYSWDSMVESQKLDAIYAIIGNDPQQRRDGLHLDSAYKSGAHLFLTEDKRNIVNHRHALEPLLGFRIFHSTEHQLVKDYIMELGAQP